MSLSDIPALGVAVIAYDSAYNVLLGQRKGSHGAGSLSLPGGKVDLGETPYKAAVRELKEETGIFALRYNMSCRVPYWSYDRFSEDDLHFVTLYYALRVPNDSEPKLMEPNKCEGWGWYRSADAAHMSLFCDAEVGIAHWLTSS